MSSQSAINSFIQNGGSYSISNQFSGLAAGTHQWSVVDSLGCIGSGSVQVSEPAGTTI